MRRALRVVGEKPSPIRIFPCTLRSGLENGFYLAGMAERHPDRNWLGIEIRFKRVVLVARKIIAAQANNARIARYDAQQLDDLFEAGELAGLHINHPIPGNAKSTANIV